MQRAARRGALAAVLSGGLLMLFAWALATTTASSESSTTCPSVLGRSLLDSSDVDAFCSDVVADRTRVMLLVAAVGLVLLIAGALRGRSGLFVRVPGGGRVSTISQGALAVLGSVTILLAVPLALGVAWLIEPSGREWNELVRSAFPVGIAAGALIAAALASVIGRGHHRMTIDHSMTATSLSMPLLALILVNLDGLGVTEVGIVDPDWTSTPWRYAVCGVPVALALVALARRQNYGFLAPSAGTAGVAIVASATALFLAMTPEAFSGSSGGGSDQSGVRFGIWLAVAVVLPWGSLLAPTRVAAEPQRSLA